MVGQNRKKEPKVGNNKMNPKRQSPSRHGVAFCGGVASLVRRVVAAFRSAPSFGNPRVKAQFRTLGAATRPAQAGFSLLEVLVAIFLLSMMGIVTADTIFRSHRTKVLIVGINDRYHGARVVLDRMTRELASSYIAQPLPGPDQSKIPQTIFKGTDENPINRLLFTSFSHVRLIRNSKESDQAVITYYGKPNPKRSGVYRLFRKHKTTIDGKPEEGGIAYELLDNVIKLEFRFWDKQKTDWVREWDTTRIENQNRLPPMVQILLTVEGENGKHIDILTRTQIYMRELIQR